MALVPLASMPGVVALAGAPAARAAQTSQTPLPGAAIRQFMDPLPDAAAAARTAMGNPS